MTARPTGQITFDAKRIIAMSNESAERKKSGINQSFEGRGWIVHGLIWGAFMFVFMGILFPLAEKKALTFPRVLTGLGIWLATGLVYGLVMRAFNRRQSRRQAKGDTN